VTRDDQCVTVCAQVFYFGIIDFLQYYNAGKKAEHAFKSTMSNPLEIRSEAQL
jgi:hypothetical protein